MRPVVIGTTKADFASTSYHKYLISIPFVLKSQVKSQVSSSIPFVKSQVSSQVKSQVSSVKSPTTTSFLP
ncbi:hypothetical protein Pelo_15178 [Pelomyxa schiedti]|nr:hypothetical protein Pelo_15178 [Pelomyxa schiedti]